MVLVDRRAEVVAVAVNGGVVWRCGCGGCAAVLLRPRCGRSPGCASAAVFSAAETAAAERAAAKLLLS